MVIISYEFAYYSVFTESIMIITSSIMTVITNGRMQELPRGPNFFLIWSKCKPQILLGVQGHAPPKKKFKWCNLVGFRLHFDNIFILKNSKNIYISEKIMIYCSHVLVRRFRDMNYE